MTEAEGNASPLQRRQAGVLLHPTSLPESREGGVLGHAARAFIDLLADSGFSVWQMLPVGPVDACGSPYSLASAHAGSPALIDTLEAGATQGARGVADTIPTALLRELARDNPEFDSWVTANRDWLAPYAMYRLLHRRHDTRPWWQWPGPYRDRHRAALAPLFRDIELQDVMAEQFLFERQWQTLRAHAHRRGVTLFGDLPFYMDLDSADVWWHRELFALDAGGRPLEVAGVPPDYFSEDGQYWGNPLYDWEAMAERGFDWWLRRLGTQLARFDLLRLDHFRALEAYWAIPAGAATAREGQWRQAPGHALLSAFRQRFGEVALVAEDLGTITPPVHALRDEFGLPGMLILQFAFDGSPDNPYLPDHHTDNAVVYTGTHDNDTTLGWYRTLDEATRERVHRWTGTGGDDIPASLVRVALESPARLAVIPMQDLLGLGSEARMNVPGSADGNWRWRMQDGQIDEDFRRRWLTLNRETGRAPG